MTMAPSSGRIVKSSKKKGGTPHHKNHRWESFTTKISKLNTLDPLKRVARHQLETEDLSTTTSYFKTGLERWQELTLSGSFIEFTHAVTPLCDSLPQILHFEDRIMDLLAGHLQVKERESMEPLLQLLADFSHDLGIRFEKHYARALELVISIARASHDVEVIEWSFTCLAFMFKYLSKLLVLDLRPTYDLMAPLLGKDRQQPHIARFAAEAMSFLIRKAAAPAVREKALDTIVEHAKTDLLKTHGSRHYGLYFHGLMTMFAEAAKGNGLTIHSSGTTIIRSMFSRHGGGDFMDIQQFSWADVICGVLTSLIHHSSSDCFKDVTATVLEQAEEAVGRFEISDTKQTFQQLMLSAKAMGILAGVRKGSRISDWPALLSSLLSVLTILSQKKSGVADHANDVEFLSAVVLSASIAVQYAPMDTLIPFISRYMCAFSTDPLSRYFLAFCSYLAEVDVERFRSFVQSYFQRYKIPIGTVVRILLTLYTDLS
jgi:U3 small nucleolar RNA-associated protein 20